MKEGRRVFLAGLFHETHTFLDSTSGLEDFEVRRGKDVFDAEGDASPLGGALEFFRKEAWEIVPGADYRATPGALVEDAVLERFWSDVNDRWDPEVDAVFLILHGAMVTESFVDAEGEILKRLRQLPGAAEMPVFGVYDLHANFSPAMASLADALIAYRRNPHTDARESSVRAARCLSESLETGERPAMVYRAAGLVWDPMLTGTDDDPMASLEAMAREMEREHDFVIAANVNAGFAFAATPDTGVSFQLVTTDREAAESLLDGLVARARELDAVTVSPEKPLEEVLWFLESDPVPGLTVLVEPSDNIGGGAPGDGTGLLRGLLRAGIRDAAVCLNDPEAVDALAECSAGDKRRLAIGGKGSRFDEGPVELELELISRSDGAFELEDPHSHLASMVGDRAEMGPCAVCRSGGVTLLLTSRKTPPFDLGQWRSQGIEPGDFRVMVVKAAVAHRQAYDPVTARSFWVSTPGPCRKENANFEQQNSV